MNARAKSRLSFIWSCIRSLEARLVYEKNPAQIELCENQIANLRAEYDKVKAGA
jgi:hypothetical protein